MCWNGHLPRPTTAGVCLALQLLPFGVRASPSTHHPLPLTMAATTPLETRTTGSGLRLSLALRGATAAGTRKLQQSRLQALRMGQAPTA